AAGTAEYRHCQGGSPPVRRFCCCEGVSTAERTAARGCARWLDRSLSCFGPPLSLCSRDLFTRFHAQYALALDLRSGAVHQARAPAVPIGRALQQSLHLL